MPDETNLTTESQRESEAGHADESHASAPINQGEPMSERIARIKREEAQREVHATSTTGLSESSNTSSTAASALRDASDPQQSAGTSKVTTIHARSDASVAAGASTLRGASPEGQSAEGTDTETARSRLAAGETARVSDGSATGERVRATSTSIVPESNDVMLGDQSTRKDGGKDTTNALPTSDANELKTDGSSSPHDATSEGGSRQEAAHQQLKDAQNKKDEDDTPPAFRAEAKARTI